MKRRDKIWKLLEKIAIPSVPVSRQRLAACVVYKNEIVSVGYNKLKTHPISKRFQKHEEAIFLHAEAMALNEASKCLSPQELSKAELYVLRVKKSDCGATVWGLSKPCSGCMSAIEHFDIKKVYYTNNASVECRSFTTIEFPNS